MPLAALATAIVSRVAARWNQTGQKHAGATDIAKTFLPAHSGWLWTLVMTTYVYLLLRLMKQTLHRPLQTIQVIMLVSNIGTILVAITFKIAFTAADAPELLMGWEAIVRLKDLFQESPLTILARYVYFGLACSSILPVLYQRWTKPRGLKTMHGWFDGPRLSINVHTNTY